VELIFRLIKGKLSGSLAITIIFVSVFATIQSITPAHGTWWDTNWLYRKMITIDHTKVTGDLTNFPVLINVSDVDLASKAQDDGDDLVFTNSSGGKLNHEIEYFNGATGHLVAWVSANLSASCDTTLFIYYGNPSAPNQQNPTAVWDSHYVMIQHLEETASGSGGTHYDSTVNNNHMTTGNGVSTNVAGKIDGADNFDGVDDLVDRDELKLQTQTISLWFNSDVKLDASGPSRDPIVNGGTQSKSGVTLQYSSYSGVGTMRVYTAYGTSWGTHQSAPITFDSNTWHHAVVVYNRTTDNVKLYVDKSKLIDDSSATAGNGITYTNGKLSLAYAFTYRWDGRIDEVRISDVARSASWIETEYNNQNNPSAFYTIGSEETSVNNPPVISNEAPANVSFGVPISLSQLSFYLSDPEGDSIDYNVITSPDIGSKSESEVSGGTKTVSISGLAYSTTYTWHANARDAGSGTWTNKTFIFITQPEPGGWFNTNWRYRKQIVINHTQVAESLTNFPVLISISDSDLADAQPDGNDIVFTDYYGNKLNHEIEKFTGNSQYFIPFAKHAIAPAVRYSGNPIFGPSASGWDSDNVRDPTLLINESGYAIKEDGNWVAYYLGNALGTPWGLGRAVSPDLYSWTRQPDTCLLSVGAAGEWDDTYFTWAGVVKRSSGEYIVSYIGKNSAYYTGIGLANSSDGIHFTRFSGNPILNQSQFNILGGSTTVSMPYLYRLGNGSWVILFEASVTGGTSIFGAITAGDDPYGEWIPMKNGEAVFTGSGSGWDATDVANPKIYEMGQNQYVLGYNGRSSTNGYTLGWAYGTSLTSWTRYGGNPILGWGPPGAFDDSRVENVIVPKQQLENPSGDMTLIYFACPGGVQHGDAWGIATIPSLGLIDLVAWVNVPSLSSTEDTVLYMYYGNPSCGNQENVAGTWDSDYRTVWHLNQVAGGGGSILDSTSNNHDGTDYGSPKFEAVGKIGTAIEFDGVNDYLTFGNPLDLQFGNSNYFTLEGWYRSFQNGISHSIVSKVQTTDDYGWGLGKWYSNDKFIFEIESGTTSRDRAYSDNPYTDTAWHHIVGVRENGIANIYVDGVKQTNYTTVALRDSGGNVLIGKFYSDYEGLYSKGIIDEVRISNVARNVGWIATEYNNQNNPSTFISVRAEEEVPAPIVSEPSPEDGAINVPVSLSTLNFNLAHSKGALMNYTVATQPDIGSGSGLNVSDGRYSASVTGLTYNTKYKWFVNVTDGKLWTNKTFDFRTQLLPGSWWNTSWLYRKNIVIDHNQVKGNLTNFPVLIDRTDSDLRAKAQADGDDITFTDYYGVRLNHEIESYDSVTGHLIAWVNVPSLFTTEDKVLYMYYGNPSCGNQENLSGVWDSHYKMVHHLEEHLTGAAGYISEWTKYPGNPVLAPSGNENSNAFASVLIVDGIYHMYYSARESSTGYYRIAHATSSDGKSWTKDVANNPVLDLDPSSDWECSMVYSPIVWIENDTWYMIYTGRGGDGSIGSLQQVGLATSSDGILWVRNPDNPVLTGGEAWEGNHIENFGVIKVNSTYYMEYGNQLPTPQYNDRVIGIATSTDLVHWTKDARNPIWIGNRYCGSWFKRGSYFYHLVPHGPTIELYRDRNPTFYPEDRVLVKEPIRASTTDTPWVLTHDIYKDTFPKDELWCYYAEPGWVECLTIETNIDAALAMSNETTTDIIFDSTEYSNDGVAVGGPASIVGMIDGAADFKKTSYNAFNCSNDSSLDLSMFTLEAWARLPVVGSGGPSGNGWMTIFEKGNTDTKRYGLWTRYGIPVLLINGKSLSAKSSDVMKDGTWAHIVATHDGTTTRLFVNGVESNSTTGWSLSPSDTAGDDLLIGQSSVSGYVSWWEGFLDEVRISDAARNLEWISTSYTNQQNPATFYTVGRQEALIPGDVNVDGIVNILDAAQISAHWYTPPAPPGPLGYDPDVDINNDGKINILDAAVVNANWQKSW